MIDLLIHGVAFVRRNIGALTLTFLGYLATALAAFVLYSYAATAPSVILAPVGVSLAAMIIAGYRVWPAIALGALVQGIIIGSPPVVLLGMVAGSTLQPLVSLYILRRLGFDRTFFRLRDMFSLVAVSFLATVIAPTLNGAFRILNAQVMDIVSPIHWTEWWLGGTVSTLVITPFLIRWIGRPVSSRSTRRYVEITLALGVVAVTSVLVFATPYTTLGGFSLVFLTIGGLFWLAFRGGVRFTTLALLLMTAISLLGSLFGTHPEPQMELSKRITNIEVFDLFIAVFFFVLVSLEEQRRRVVHELQGHAKKLEDALRRINMEADAKNEFIALLGHELRNPLAALLSSVELLKIVEPPAHERAEILAMMNGRIRSMSHLLDDILDISRITRRKFNLHKKRTPLDTIVRSAQRAVEPLMRSHAQKCVVAYPDPRVIVDADPTRLEQVIVNLAHNAAKYSPDGSTIHCVCRYEAPRGVREGQAVIEVRDSGIGIRPEMLERIFEPFVQMHAKQARGVGGLGLGLALAKSLVEMHGGTIAARSAGEGKGSVFTVRLPAALEDRRPVPIPETPDRSKVPHLRILVVDDNVEAAGVLGRLLRHRGHHVKEVYDGSGVIPAVSTQKPDVVFLDIGLPDIDGYEIAQKLRADKHSGMLVALSGYGQEEDKKKAFEAGFDQHLTKPAALVDIERIISQTLRARPATA